MVIRTYPLKPYLIALTDSLSADDTFNVINGVIVLPVGGEVTIYVIGGST